MISEKKIIIRRTIMDVPLILFLVTELISTILSMDTRTSLLGYYSRFNGGLVSSVTYSLLYWAYVSNMDTKKTKRSIYILLASGFLVSLYAILEHFGIDKNIWVQDVQNRVFSTLGQPNWLAAWIIAIIPLTWALSLNPKSNIFSRSFWLWNILSFIFLITLLFTKSKSGFLGFVFADIIFLAGAVFSYLKSHHQIIKLLKKLAVIHLFLVITILLVGTPLTPNILTLLNKDSNKSANIETSAQPTVELGGTDSGVIRRIVWNGAIDIWKHYPVFGTGVETFAFAYYKYRPVEHNLTSEWDFLYNKAHNEYLNYLATTGTLGFLSYITLIIFTLYVIGKPIFKSKTQLDQLEIRSIRNFQIALASGYISILVTNFFGFSVVPVQLLFFLFPAFAISIELESKRAEEHEYKAKLTGIQKTSLVILSSFTLLLFYSTLKYWYADILYNRGKNEGSAGNYIEAVNNLQTATKLSPYEAIFWNELADAESDAALAYLNSGNKDLSFRLANATLTSLQKSMDLSSSNVNLKRNQARIYIKFTAFDNTFLTKAKDSLTDAINYAPTDAKLYYNLALTYLRLGENEKAKELLNKTIEMKANYRDARYALALVLIDEGKKDGAKIQIDYILTYINPDDTLANEALIEIKEK
jgi:O-antigen ligase/Flp pilus assembly protein TadD